MLSLHFKYYVYGELDVSRFGVRQASMEQREELEIRAGNKGSKDIGKINRWGASGGGGGATGLLESSG